MWPFTRRAPAERPLRDIRERLEYVEDDVARLERRFESLRGSVTGALRRQRQAPPEPELEDDEAEELEDDAIEHALGAERRFGREKVRAVLR